MGIKHALIVNPALHGFEYGSLRDFESAILRMTGASPAVTPNRSLPRWLSRRLAHGTRYGSLRRFVPKAESAVEADVLWCALMGPETFNLDLYKSWQSRCGYKILYVMDTFAQHVPVLRRVLEAADWDLTITSFHCAVPMLEEATQRRWHAVAQGVCLDRFAPAPDAHRIIDFSAYGRRLSLVHERLIQHARKHQRFYDFSTSSALAPAVSSEEAYGQYAWHLRHSAFTFCWPVQLTSPDRAGSLSPITCRWFEAAASGAVVLGQTPRDPAFAEIFGNDAVCPIDQDMAASQLDECLDSLHASKAQLLEAASSRRRAHAAEWSWDSRVEEIARLGGLDLAAPAHT